MLKIDFNHFYIETISHMEKEYAEMLNPNLMQFFKVKNVYLALSFQDKNVIINYAINTGKKVSGDWLEDLRVQAISGGMEYITFITSEKNKPVQQLAEKWGAVLIKTNPNYYSDGSDSLVFEYKLNKEL